MNTDHLLAFLSISLVATLSPGPAVILAIRNGALFGVRRAAVGIFGNLAALMTYALLASSGTAVIFSLFPKLLFVFQVVGGMYLIYMGYKMLTSKKEWRAFEGGNVTNGRLFVQAMFTGFSNPKVIVFYASLFPQFINVGEGYAANAVALALIFGACSAGALLMYASMSRALVSRPRGFGVLRLVNKISGGVFCAFGTALAYGASSR